MKIPLKEATNHHFHQQHLSEQQLRLLQKKINITYTSDKTKIDKAITNKPIRKGITRWIAIAAMTMFTITGFMSLNNHFEDKTLKIVREVVSNHARKKPLEIVSENFTQTSNYFSQLDFAPLPSSLVNSTAVKMLGGRYCSIKSQSAAQLRYQDNKGKLLTLYQVSFDRDIFGAMPNIDKGEEPNVYYMDGLKVSLWTEKGLLMVRVEAP